MDRHGLAGQTIIRAASIAALAVALCALYAIPAMAAHLVNDQFNDTATSTFIASGRYDRAATPSPGARHVPSSPIASRTRGNPSPLVLLRVQEPAR